MSKGRGGIYLLLGGNLGNVVDNFKKVEELTAPKLDVLRKSSVYESEPWGMKSPHLFYNQVWEVTTSLAPSELLQFLLKVEVDLGRVRSEHSSAYTDRPIDIDILLYGSRLIVQKDLVLPHPRMSQRAFTLLPLLELQANLRDPSSGELYQDKLDALNESDKNAVKRINN